MALKKVQVSTGIQSFCVVNRMALFLPLLGTLPTASKVSLPYC